LERGLQASNGSNVKTYPALASGGGDQALPEGSLLPPSITELLNQNLLAFHKHLDATNLDTCLPDKKDA